MSQFLPTGSSQAQTPSGVANIAPSDPETSSADIALMQRVLSAAYRNPNLIPQDFMAYVLDWIQTQRLTIPIGQVFGFSQFTVNSAEVGTQESTTSTTYTDLTTAGPTLDGLSAGKYVILVGAVAMDASGQGAFIAPSTGGDEAGGETQSSVFTSIMGVSTHALTSAGSISAKYRSNGGGTCTFLNRWILALKYANL